MATPRSTATSPVSAFPNDLFPLDFLNFPTGPGSTSGSIGMGMDSPEGGMMGMTDSSQAQQMGMYGGLGAGGNDLGTAGSGSNHPTPGNGNLGNTHSQAQGLNIDTSGFDFADGMTGTSNGAGPSSQSYNNGQSHTHNRRDSQGGSLASISEAGPSNTAPGRSTSNRGRPRKSDASKTAKRKSTGQTAARGSINGGMDIDTDPSQLQAHAQALWSQSQAQGMVVDGSGQEMDFPPSGGFGVPIGMLQQLEGFHMQSPLAFDPKNAQSYSNLMPFLSEEAKNGLAQGQLPIGMNGGLLTPGPSGDMFPQFRMDGPQMSPMTLEMLARGEGMDQNSSEFNLLPLLSPALHGHSQSLPSDLTSPAAGFAFSHPHSLGSDSSMQAGHDSQSQNHSQQQGHHPGLHQNTQSGSGSSSVSNLAGRSPLEALQEQQRLFQEQLTALQDQQRQLQATAAAVAAQAMQQQQQQSMAQQGQGQSPARGGNMGMGSTFASGSQQTSPYIAGTSGASSTSGPSRPATTPGNMGSAEPSPSYFSPLTSPALEASARFQSFGHSGGRTSQYNQTFPLSALSSPALNPVGSSGGANQTLSPALNPVLDSGLDDPEYVRQLLGSMDQMGNNGATGQGMMMQGQNGNSGAPMAGAPSQIFSPVQMPTMASHSHGHSHSSHTSSPLVTGSAGSSAGPGPHRQSLPPKTRPSPLIKPTHHRHRHGGNGSIPSSPLIPIYKNSNAAAMAMMGGGNATNGAVVPGTYLPSAAVEQVAQTASTSSTPSPVDLRDLRDIMPPPPVPSKHTQNGDGSMNGMGMSGHGMVQPMTPAAMMNMGSHPVGMSMSMSRGIGSGMGSVTLPSSNAAEEQRLTGKGSGINGAGPARVANGATSGANQGQGNGAKMPIAPGPKGRKTAIAPAAPHAQDGPSPGAAGSAVRKGKGVKKGGRGGGAVGVRAAIKGAALAAAIPVPDGENRKSSHKAAEQKRRDSLKAGFDELRLLLPPINTEALDPESGEPIPGSSAPRLLPKSSLVPDDNPNRGVSKVALLKFSNEYIVKLHSKVDKRDLYIEKLREEVARLRAGGEGEEVKMTVLVEPDEEDDDLDGLDEDEDVGGGAVEEEVDLLMYDVTAGEEEDEEGDEDAEDGEEGEGSENEAGGGDEDMEDTDDKALTLASASGGNKRARNSVGAASQVGQPKRLTRVASSGRLKGRKSD